MTGEMVRVTKPDGSIVVYDVMRTGNDDLVFPMPWSSTPEYSFVDTTDAPPELDRGKHLLITNAERDCSATVGFLDAAGENKMMVKADSCFSSEVRLFFWLAQISTLFPIHL